MLLTEGPRRVNLPPPDHMVSGPGPALRHSQKWSDAPKRSQALPDVPRRRQDAPKTPKRPPRSLQDPQVDPKSTPKRPHVGTSGTSKNEQNHKFLLVVWRSRGSIMRSLGVLLGSSWGSWSDLGGLLGVLGASWRRLDGVLGRLGVLGNA